MPSSSAWFVLLLDNVARAHRHRSVRLGLLKQGFGAYFRGRCDAYPHPNQKTQVKKLDHIAYGANSGVIWPPRFTELFAGVAPVLCCFAWVVVQKHNSGLNAALPHGDQR